jgi:hypothetical protein
MILNLRHPDPHNIGGKAMHLSPQYPAYSSWVLGHAHLVTGRYGGDFRIEGLLHQ